MATTSETASDTPRRDEPRRGELRIYFGAAPGVGKTYAMLGEAYRRLGRGTDVVVGLVETHERAKTDQLLDGLEIMPSRIVTHRGLELTELDLDAELLATIEESADRLSGLIDNLLDSSRLATGAVRLRLRAVTYDEVVARALAGLDGWAAVSVDVDERLPPVVADAGLLERVVANVVDNALRHGPPVRSVPPDEPAIAIRASAHSDWMELRLGDAGSGIGLGMSVAKGFMDAMNGVIRTEDTPGGGLTVVISLPVDGGRQ